MAWRTKGKKGKILRKEGGRWRSSGGKFGSSNFVSSSNPMLKMLAFDEDHDFNLVPESDVPGEPLKVNISVNLRNLLQVDEISQLVTVEVSIRMQWFNDRVRLNNETLASLDPDVDFLTLNPRLADHIWIPDIFIDQAKELREPTFHVLPASLRFYR